MSGTERSRTAVGSVADQVVEAVLTASRVLVAVSARSLSDVEDTVTVTQFRALVVLDNHGTLNLNGLADALNVQPSTALRTLDRLVDAGLANREENARNRREVVLSLTEEGSRLVHTVTARRRHEIARILGQMPARRRNELLSAFRAFSRAADEPDVDRAAAPLGW